MNSEQTSHELIDAYLQGDLSGDALVEFEFKMKEDPELAAFIRRQQMVREAALDKQRNAFIQTLNKIPQRKKIPWFKRFLQQMPDLFPTSPAPEKIYGPLGLATLFIIAGISGWYIFLHDTSPKLSSQKPPVPTTYDLIAPIIPSATMGTNKDSMRVEGGRLFKQKLFGQAIPFFENALQENPNDITVRLLLGICRKETGQQDEALKEFQQVIDAQAADSDIAWLAMAEIYRKKGDLTRYEEVLTKVDTFVYARPESRATAKKMLEEIEYNTTK